MDKRILILTSQLFQRLGKAISLSVERFYTVGETVGEEGGREPGRGGSSREQHQQRNNSDGQDRKDLLEACRERRHTGKLVEKLAKNLAVQVKSPNEIHKTESAIALMKDLTIVKYMFFHAQDIVYLTFKNYKKIIILLNILFFLPETKLSDRC